MQGRGKHEIPEKIHETAASPGTIPTCDKMLLNVLATVMCIASLRTTAAYSGSSRTSSCPGGVYSTFRNHGGEWLLFRREFDDSRSTLAPIKPVALWTLAHAVRRCWCVLLFPGLYLQAISCFMFGCASDVSKDGPYRHLPDYRVIHEELPQHSWLIPYLIWSKIINVWCGVLHDQMILPFSFPGRLTGVVYLPFLQEELLLLLENNALAVRRRIGGTPSP
ncbi:hypothetical protein PR048_025582 [Dryococelus australis]|uniref:Uncharacterized protein n=1 Tax=Dryococelus australis TaxID=614101 RepID=A0ABQ9GRT8_9NEOP|nr:hypothetical protein PR048_025582 [Dryococelus australis]